LNKTSAQDQLEMEMRNLIELYKNEELSITVAGHSLGSALATLSAYDLSESEFNKVTVGEEKVTTPITVFSFEDFPWT
jgi:alpha-beta hydrolase superfamily lysophospholipase